MICKNCAISADWGKFGKNPDNKGHEYCEGCDCQHHPVGTRQIQKESND